MEEGQYWSAAAPIIGDSEEEINAYLVQRADADVVARTSRSMKDISHAPQEQAGQERRRRGWYMKAADGPSPACFRSDRGEWDYAMEDSS